MSERVYEADEMAIVKVFGGKRGILGILFLLLHGGLFLASWEGICLAIGFDLEMDFEGRILD